MCRSVTGMDFALMVPQMGWREEEERTHLSRDGSLCYLYARYHFYEFEMSTLQKIER